MPKLPAATDASPEQIVRAMARGRPARRASAASGSSFSGAPLREFVRESILDGIEDAGRDIAELGDVEVLDHGVENVIGERVDAQNDHQ